MLTLCIGIVVICILIGLAGYFLGTGDRGPALLFFMWGLMATGLFLLIMSTQVGDPAPKAECGPSGCPVQYDQ